MLVTDPTILFCLLSPLSTLCTVYTCSQFFPLLRLPALSLTIIISVVLTFFFLHCLSVLSYNLSHICSSLRSNLSSYYMYIFLFFCYPAINLCSFPPDFPPFSPESIHPLFSLLILLLSFQKPLCNPAATLCNSAVTCPPLQTCSRLTSATLLHCHPLKLCCLLPCYPLRLCCPCYSLRPCCPCYLLQICNHLHLCFPC
jgi:hypothetical protein